MARFHKCEVYDLCDLTKKEMRLLIAGLTHILQRGQLPDHYGYTIGDVTQLKAELQDTMDDE
jgi:hypothetical protein